MIAPVLTTAKVILPAQYQTKYFLHSHPAQPFIATVSVR